MGQEAGMSPPAVPADGKESAWTEDPPGMGSDLFMLPQPMKLLCFSCFILSLLVTGTGCAEAPSMWPYWPEYHKTPVGTGRFLLASQRLPMDWLR